MTTIVTVSNPADSTHAVGVQRVGATAANVLRPGEACQITLSAGVSFNVTEGFETAAEPTPAPPMPSDPNSPPSA